MLIRFAIGLFILAGLFFLYQWWKGYSQDPDLPVRNDTAGMIAAIRLDGDNSQVVVIGPDGKVKESPGYEAGKTDKEPVWRPDGNRLFFTSDREEEAFQVYRWNLASDSIMRRSVGSRSQSTPSFAPEDNTSGLLTAGGFVLEFDPKEVATRQILPPVGKNRQGGEGGQEGTASQFEQIYQRLGNSFRAAKWLKGKQYVAAVMRREEGGEILIVQDVVNFSRPVPIMAGNRIDFDVSQTEPKVFFTVNGFFFHDPNQIPPEAVKNGKVELPFTSIIGGFDPTGQGSLFPIMTVKQPELGFRDLKVSPDGRNVLMIAGKLDANGNFEPSDLVVAPAAAGGGPEAKRIISGKIYEPSWHPNSHTIAFVQRDDKGRRGIFTINKDGSGINEVTKGDGDYSWPVFSPQSK